MFDADAPAPAPSLTITDLLRQLCRLDAEAAIVTEDRASLDKSLAGLMADRQVINDAIIEAMVQQPHGDVAILSGPNGSLWRIIDGMRITQMPKLSGDLPVLAIGVNTITAYDDRWDTLDMLHHDLRAQIRAAEGDGCGSMPRAYDHDPRPVELQAARDWAIPIDSMPLRRRASGTNGNGNGEVYRAD